jgi:GAF domain-containing protein
MPLIGGDGKPLAVLSTHFRHKHRPSKEELHLLDLYASQAADFIERTLIDQNLLESEQRFRLVADAAPVLIWMSDIAFSFVSHGNFYPFDRDQ